MLKEIQERRSVRKYRNTPVPEDVIADLMESARIAPSGSNTQPWHFIVIKDADTRERLTEVSHDQNWMRSAPLFIVCIADLEARNPDEGIIADEESPERDVKLIIRDTAIAVEHIVLNAMHHGLGTCWVAWYEQADIKLLLGLPENKYVVCILTVGYPDQEFKPHVRKKIEEIVHYEKWQNK